MLQPFSVVGPINRGGFGRVEKVRLPSGEIAARKIFEPGPAFSATDIEKHRQRFLREVRTQRALSQRDYVLPILFEELTGANPWFVMPLAARSFAEQMKEDKAHGNLSHEALADIINGLEVLHRLGYTHRDLKPANVLLHQGRWKLSDFGLVAPPTGTTTKITSLDSAWGTTEYCAPEQARGFGSATPAADIYAFGCILHDVFVGTPRVPYHRQTGPGAIGRVIEKCTELVPTKRFRDMNSLRNALFTTLSSPTTPLPPPDADAQAWITALGDTGGWTVERLEQFGVYLETLGVTTQSEPAFQALNGGHFKAFFALDAALGETIGNAYCRWAHGTIFAFSYCDVVVGRLRAIFEVGTLTSKAVAALAAAELGRSHNRWFVMTQLIDMCGPALSDQVAERVALEIQIEGAEANFQRCVSEVDQTVESFHPRIAAVLRNKP